MYIRPAPVIQPGVNVKRKEIQKIFNPGNRDLKINLPVTTTKRVYSEQIVDFSVSVKNHL